MAKNKRRIEFKNVRKQQESNKKEIKPIEFLICTNTSRNGRMMMKKTRVKQQNWKAIKIKMVHGINVLIVADSPLDRKFVGPNCGFRCCPMFLLPNEFVHVRHDSILGFPSTMVLVSVIQYSIPLLLSLWFSTNFNGFFRCFLCSSR